MDLEKALLESDFGHLLKLILTGVMEQLPEDAEVVAIRLQLAYTTPALDNEVVAVGQTRSTTHFNPVDLSAMFLEYARGQHVALEREFGPKDRENGGLLRGPRRRPRRTPT